MKHFSIMRSRLVRKLILPVLAVLLLVSLAAPVSAESASAYTYTPSVTGDWIRTQDAYQVSNVIMQEITLTQAQDIIVKDGILYVADTGGGRVILYNLEDGSYTEWGKGELKAPSGLFVNEDGSLYVADSEAGEMFIFDADGNITKRLGRPTTVTFGSDAIYRPSKVVVNAAGTIYIVSEGSFDGIVQLDHQGEFLGYFGYNNNPITLWDYVVDFFFTEEMKAQLTNRIPYSFKSVAMDNKGMMYTVTQSAEGNALKKHDVAGHNLLPNTMADEPDFIDVCVGPENRIYAATSTGLLFEYDVNGELLFTFGGRAIAAERNGVFTTVSAITCDDEGRLYVLDGERGLVHIMRPTDYAETYHEAISLYNLGKYEESAQLWRHIAAVGGAGYYVENSLAQCLFEEQEYELAVAHYKLAGNKEGYSEAYWQIRNDQIGILVPYAIGGIILLIIARILYKKFHKPSNKPKKPSIWKDDFLLIFKVIRHPIDGFYAIRREGKGHIPTALVLYVIEYLLFIGYFMASGFALIGNTAQETSILLLSMLFWVPVALFVGSNYLVSSVGEGEARFRDVLVATPYVLSPFAVTMPFIILISHIITGNELRLLQLALTAMLFWVVAYLFIATREIHAFETGPAIANLLITVFLMAVVVLAVSLVYMFCDQLVSMVISVIKEVNYRVFLS
ncbi:MAG: hypothetical protein J6B93_04255 [Clostridia bacterium]|nr:hypothetical protein [Clostridia bacterium]